jgi:hypothetical protein
MCSFCTYVFTYSGIVDLVGELPIIKIFGRWTILGIDFLCFEWTCAADFFFEKCERVINIWKCIQKIFETVIPLIDRQYWYIRNC